MRATTALGLMALIVLVGIGVVFCLNQAAHADISPIIMPTHPADPPMQTGVTTKPTPDSDGYWHSQTTMGVPSATPAATATPYGGMFKQ